ncbi:MAG: SMI1/KNR4 family protein [Ruminococcus sp.]|nr:SMI1/KNR4 family protein [Ruminococcus sp.]
MFMNDEKPKNLQECLERLKKGCETLSAECNYSEDYSQFNPPATEEEIVKFESTLKFPLPQEYREFLKFSNGARIMGEDIYSLEMIGSNDQYVPDGYLVISSTEMTSERMAISEEDGQVYLFWDLKGNPWNIEDYFYDQLEECKKIIDAHDREVEQQKRRENGISEEQEMFELYSKLVGEEKAKILLEERKNRGK